MLIELNCDYYLRILFKRKVDPHSKFKSVDELFAELRELMIIYQENLYHA